MTERDALVNSDYLVMQGIDKWFDATHALKDVTFSARLGEVHAIVGENGAGKSTLMKILSGAVMPTSGNILLDQKIVQITSPIQAHALGIRAVHQEFSLVPQLNVTENILLGQLPTLRNTLLIDWNAAHSKARKLLDSLGFQSINVREKVSRLSVSRQQMVEIAKASASEPKIWILDEPSAVLSQEELKQLFALILRLKHDNALILYISHRLEEVFQISDRITVLKDGELIKTVQTDSVNQEDVIRLMVGRNLGDIFPERHSEAGKTTLKVTGITRKPFFQDVSFSLNQDEITGFFGLVGSGRTQIARCIFGADPLDAGEITLDGKPVAFSNPSEAVAAGIAFLTEDRKRDGLVMSGSVRDNAILASLKRFSKFIFIDQAQRDRIVTEKIKELDIKPPQLRRNVRQLSGGNQQKVVLSKWLLTNARILILDEPTRGVDVATKVEIYRLISDLAKSHVTILLISSELPEILGLCDRALVMHEGRLVCDLPRSEFTEEKILTYAAGVAR